VEPVLHLLWDPRRLAPHAAAEVRAHHQHLLGLTAYVAAKHAINGLTKAVAKEVGTQGVTVNAICPGLVITDIIQRNGPATAQAMGITYDEMVALFAAESAIKRPNTLEEVAAVAVLLASDVAAGITGAIYSVDGGTAAY
jgi:NAD(P)-dependent dehydrogenase (short-subunit alcohol dehydrogenase family)